MRLLQYSCANTEWPHGYGQVVLLMYMHDHVSSDNTE